MKIDAKYEVIKAIPITKEKNIPLGSMIYRRHGVYYMDGGLLPQNYQRNFDELIDYEEENGWYYLCPIKTIEAFKKND